MRVCIFDRMEECTEEAVQAMLPRSLSNAENKRCDSAIPSAGSAASSPGSCSGTPLSSIAADH